MPSKNLYCRTDSTSLRGFVCLNEAEPRGGQAETSEKIEKDPMTKEQLLKLKDDILGNLLKKDKQEVWQSFLKSLEDSKILNSGTNVLTGLLKIEGDGYERKAEGKPNERRVYLQGFSNVIFLQALLTKLMEDPALGISSPGELDGRWGQKTEDSLRSLQKSLKLKPDGQFGPKTFEALRNAFEKKEVPPVEPEKIVLEKSLQFAVDEGVRKLRIAAPNTTQYFPAMAERDQYDKESKRIHFPLRTNEGKLVYLEVEGQEELLARNRTLILKYLNQEFGKTDK